MNLHAAKLGIRTGESSWTRSFRSSTGPAALLAMLLGIVVGCQSPARKGVPLASQKLEVDGHHMNALITGGNLPVVVFESALGEPLASWAPVIPEVAPYTACFAYDRLGIGKSQPGALPRDGRTIARELHTALHTAHLPAPYVLAAHSSGAFYSRIFAAMYPNEVAGMVLVEPASADFLAVLKQDYPSDYQVFVMKRDDPNLPRPVRDEASAWDTTVEELRALPAPKIPVTIITAEDSWRLQKELWWAAHEEMLTNSSNPRHYLAEGSGHYVQVNQPAFVAQAILELVTDYRTHKPGVIPETTPATSPPQ